METLLAQKKKQLTKCGPPKGEPKTQLKEFHWTKENQKQSPLAPQKFNPTSKQWETH